FLSHQPRGIGSQGFTPHERIERPPLRRTPFLSRLDAFEEALVRSGPEDRPPRYDVEILVALPEDFEDLRLGRRRYVDQGDRVAFIGFLRGEGRHDRAGSDPAWPREDLVVGDLDRATLLGLEIEHRGLGGE